MLYKHSLKIKTKALINMIFLKKICVEEYLIY